MKNNFTETLFILAIAIVTLFGIQTLSVQIINTF